MLPDDYARVREAADADAYKAGLVAFANRMDFSTISTILVIERLQRPAEVIEVHNTPDAFLGKYSDSAGSKRDPVARRLQQMNCPILWDQSTYADDKVGDLWEEQAPYDYHTGVAMALHLPNGKHFYLGVDRRNPLPSDQIQLTRILADLQLLAVYALEATQRLLPRTEPEAPIYLTRRECEVLHWTLLGKSAWAIAQICGVSENTIHWHVQQAMRKLSCENKLSAALKARDRGLI